MGDARGSLRAVRAIASALLAVAHECRRAGRRHSGCLGCGQPRHGHCEWHADSTRGAGASMPDVLRALRLRAYPCHANFKNGRARAMVKVHDIVIHTPTQSLILVHGVAEAMYYLSDTGLWHA